MTLLITKVLDHFGDVITYKLTNIQLMDILNLKGGDVITYKLTNYPTYDYTK